MLWRLRDCASEPLDAVPGGDRCACQMFQLTKPLPPSKRMVDGFIARPPPALPRWHGSREDLTDVSRSLSGT